MTVLVVTLVTVEGEAVTVTVGMAALRVVNCVIVWRDRGVSFACSKRKRGGAPID